MQGFLVLDYIPRSQKALEEIATWVMKGKIKHREDIQEGIANCPQTLNRLFTGENKGKQLLKI
jgi:NADPH-dependent curcumin reductase CurA